MKLRELPIVMAVLQNTLQNSKIFGDLNPSAISKISPYCKRFSLKKGEFLYRQGDESFGFFIVQRGYINLYHQRNSKQIQNLSMFSEFDSFGEAVMSGLNQYQATAQALTEVDIICVEKEYFSKWVYTYPECLLKAMSAINQRMYKLVENFETQRFCSADTRLAQFLVANMECIANRFVVHLEISKKILALQLGITGETLSRTLGNFKEYGLIDVCKSSIEILDLETLKEI